MPVSPARQSFYDAVYDFVRAVPAGSVVTYGQVAVELGAPSHARAVGYALSSLGGQGDVPWWRVINASGEISLKNRGAAADLQRHLLEQEGVYFSFEGRVDLRSFRYNPHFPRD